MHSTDRDDGQASDLPNKYTYAAEWFYLKHILILIVVHDPRGLTYNELSWLSQRRVVYSYTHDTLTSVALWLDLSGSKSLLDGEAIQTLVCTATESSIGDVGDTEETIQVDVNSTCNGVALSLANSEHSTSKDNPQAPGWTKRYTSVNACFYFEHMPTLTGMYVPSKNTKV